MHCSERECFGRILSAEVDRRKHEISLDKDAFHPQALRPVVDPALREEWSQTFDNMAANSAADGEVGVTTLVRSGILFPEVAHFVVHIIGCSNGLCFTRSEFLEAMVRAYGFR